MISDCGSEVERLTTELAESKEKTSLLEARLGDIKGKHSLEMSQLEARIADPERDIGKTTSLLIKEKKTRKSNASEVCRLRCIIQGYEGSTNCRVEEYKAEVKSALCIEF